MTQSHTSGEKNLTHTKGEKNEQLNSQKLKRNLYSISANGWATHSLRNKQSLIVQQSHPKFTHLTNLSFKLCDSFPPPTFNSLLAVSYTHLTLPTKRIV